ncbi:MAG: hypothetical protein JJV92_03770 [Desulfosarcina sp.]|nr:hypothetical protein [Desulfobacterales bacterium]
MIILLPNSFCQEIADAPKQAGIMLNEIAKNISTEIAAHWQAPLPLSPAICKKIKYTGGYLKVKDMAVTG